MPMLFREFLMTKTIARLAPAQLAAQCHVPTGAPIPVLEGVQQGVLSLAQTGAVHHFSCHYLDSAQQW